ncbi:hypothetical protein ACVW1A_004503 [Bradyrhizobium sp. LB1.3]
MFKVKGHQSSKNSAIKALSYEEALAELESLKQEHKEFLKGHRKTLYQFLQRAAETALSVEADETTTSRLRKKIGEKDVLRGALIFIFDANSESDKKEASKRAQALRYLIDKLQVAVEDIATAILKNGGIEKLARLAAKTRQDEPNEDQEDQDGDNQDEEAVESLDAERKFGRQIRVGLSPKLSEKLTRFAENARIKIIGYVRMSSDELPTVKVEKIIAIQAKGKTTKAGNAKTAGKKHDDGSWG